MHLWTFHDKKSSRINNSRTKTDSRTNSKHKIILSWSEICEHCNICLEKNKKASQRPVVESTRATDFSQSVAMG